MTFKFHQSRFINVNFYKHKFSRFILSIPYLHTVMVIIDMRYRYKWYQYWYVMETEPVILQDWKLTHDDLLLKADLPLLSKRRDFATLCQLFKIVYKLCSSPNPYNPHPRPGLRNLNSMALDTPFCRLSLTQKSFYPYAPSLWNYLPDSTVKCPTLTAFKSAISQLFC